MNPTRIQTVKYSPCKTLICRLLFIYVLFFVPLTRVTAQEVSVLPQFFAANPLVKRDPVFEKIHTYLNESVENTTLGLTENLSGKLNKVKTSLDSLSLKVAVTNDPTK